MRPSDVTLALASLIPTRQPLYLWGPPGVGKSSLVKQAAKECGRRVVDVRAVLLDPVDLRGLPRVTKSGAAEWCPPSFLPREGEGVLFLDELAQAAPLVQSACLSLTLDRRIGEYELPPGWTVIAASNRQEDRAGAHRLITPLLNRFIHLDLEVSNEDWQHWSLGAGIAPEVRSFLAFRPGLLFSFEPNAGQRAFPTPRSWSFVSDVLPHTPPALLHPVLAGAISEGPAAEFVGFLKIHRDLPDLDQLLANPAAAPVPREPAVLYALSGAVVERCRKADDPLLTKVMTYADRLPPEFSVLTVRDASVVNARILHIPAANAWLRKNHHLLRPAGAR